MHFPQRFAKRCNLSDQANITLATGDHNFPDLPNFILAVSESITESPDNHDVPSNLHTGDLKNNSDENSVTIATNEKHSLTFVLNGAGLDTGIVETRSRSSDELPSTSWREYTLSESFCIEDTKDGGLESNTTLLQDDATSTSSATKPATMSTASLDNCSDTGSKQSESQPWNGLDGWLKQSRPAKCAVSVVNLTAECTQRPTKRTKVDEEVKLGAVGISRSARASRQLRAASNSSRFVVCPNKLARWKAKVLELDNDAEFNDTNCRLVRHSKCGKDILVKEPYDVSRFRTHLGECQSGKLGGMPTVKQWAQKFGITMMKSSGHNSHDHGYLKDNVKVQSCLSQSQSLSLACPGISSADEPLIPVYLRCTPVGGGGSRSIVVISKELFQKTFRNLTMAKKRIVVDTQAHERKWLNDHQVLRVFASGCEKTGFTKLPDGRVQPCTQCKALLDLRAFKKAIRKPVPSDKHLVHVNHRFRPALLAMIYAKYVGVGEIIETAVRNSICDIP